MSAAEIISAFYKLCTFLKCENCFLYLHKSVIAYCKDNKKNLNIILSIVLFNKHLIMDNVKITLIVVLITIVTIYLFIFAAILP